MEIGFYIERIERYAQGQMPEAERADFEAELASNAELRQAYDLFQWGDAAIEQSIEQSLRQQLQEWAAEGTAVLSANPPRAKVVEMRPNWSRWAVAASVILLAGFLLFRSAGAGYTDTALFAANYDLPPAATIRSGSATENFLEPGFKAMKTNDFQKAADVFQGVPANSTRYTEAQFYLGHAAMQLNNYDLAITAFQTAAQGNEFKFTEKAQWNLVLTYLAASRTKDQNFKSRLENIIAHPEHSYHQNAVALQQKLGSVFRR